MTQAMKPAANSDMEQRLAWLESRTDRVWRGVYGDPQNKFLSFPDRLDKIETVADHARDLVTELQVHQKHDRESLKDIKTMLNKIQWWLLIMALGQVVMFLYLVKG